MARPISRRSRSEEDEEPTADKYSRRGRSEEQDDDATEERRPRRGRGELPPTGRRGAAAEEPEEPRGRRRGRSEEPEERPSRRSRREEPEEPQGDEYPATPAELEKLSDKDYEALLEEFDIPQGKPEDEFDNLWAEIEAKRESEPPSRGRRGRGREEEEESPRGRRGRGRSDEDDEDDNDRPTRKPRPGFEGFKKTKEATYKDIEVRLGQDEELFKFLDDGPFDTYAEHGLYDELKDGQRVWVCLEVDCPICATGHQARPIGLYAVVRIPEEGDPEVRIIKAGPGLTSELETKSKLKTGPLSAPYYGMSQTKAGKKEGPVKYSVNPYREREVEEEWKFKPFTEKELDEFRNEAPDPATYVKMPRLSDMKEVARKLRSGD